MAEWQLKTPVAFIIFNRPDTTAQVFEAIRQAQPPQLLVIADGPRPDHPGDIEKCAAALSVIDQVDWDCEVLTNFADTNIGCKRRVSSGLDWVFDTVEQAIILEDDCFPHPTFFRFCEELLEKYQDDERIMAVSGQNLQLGRKRTEYSYYFSRYTHCWGWATWRRAWQHFDFEMTLWPTIRDSGWLRGILSEPASVRYWSDVFQSVYSGCLDTWAYRWMFSCWIQNGLTVLPNVNLVSNIGFAADATHTKRSSLLSNMPVGEMVSPIQHPPFVIRNAQADQFTQRTFYNRSLLTRAKAKIRRLFQRVL